MLKKIEQFIQEKALFSKQDLVCLAISGGIDSVVLAHCLHQMGYQMHLLHCNFQLRGEESLEDEKFVRHLAIDLDCEVTVKRFEITDGSVQEQARKLRYDWFREEVEQLNGILATAHHQSDVLETILINLGRGTGLEGLHGILPKNEWGVVRPLLCVNKEEILAFASENNIRYREDSSNKTEAYIRNKIRHKVIPNLKEIFPNIEERAWETSQRLYEAELQLPSIDNLVMEEEEGMLRLALVNSDQQGIAKLYYACKKYGFNKQSISDLVRSRQVGSKVESGEWELSKDRNSYILKKNIALSDESPLIKVNVKNQTIETPIGKLNVEVDAFLPDLKNITKQQCYLDATLLSYPLTLRKWKKGDKFKPLGMNGFKKISDFLVDKKIPLAMKDQIWVLCSQEEIVWVLNHRLDDRYKVTPETEEVLRLELLI